MTEAMTVNSPSHEEDFDDVGCNADLYASRQDTFQVEVASLTRNLKFCGGNFCSLNYTR